MSKILCGCLPKLSKENDVLSFIIKEVQRVPPILPISIFSSSFSEFTFESLGYIG